MNSRPNVVFFLLNVIVLAWGTGSNAVNTLCCWRGYAMIGSNVAMLVVVSAGAELEGRGTKVTVRREVFWLIEVWVRAPGPSIKDPKITRITCNNNFLPPACVALCFARCTWLQQLTVKQLQHIISNALTHPLSLLYCIFWSIHGQDLLQSWLQWLCGSLERESEKFAAGPKDESSEKNIAFHFFKLLFRSGHIHRGNNLSTGSKQEEFRSRFRSFIGATTNTFQLRLGPQL